MESGPSSSRAYRIVTWLPDCACAIMKYAMFSLLPPPSNVPQQTEIRLFLEVFISNLSYIIDSSEGFS
jgi:hypothetical protein